MSAFVTFKILLISACLTKCLWSLLARRAVFAWVYMWGISAHIQGSHVGCSGLQGLCRSRLRLWRILRLTEPTIHNSTPVVGAGVPGPGLGLGRAGRRGDWLVSIIDRIMKLRWLMKAEKRRQTWIYSHPHTQRRDATHVHRAKLTSHGTEKREKMQQITWTKNISVWASSPSVFRWVTKHDLSVMYPRCDSFLAGLGAQWLLR